MLALLLHPRLNILPFFFCSNRQLYFLGVLGLVPWCVGKRGLTLVCTVCMFETMVLCPLPLVLCVLIKVLGELYVNSYYKGTNIF